MLVKEWTEGEEVTSGLNLYGEVGGVATEDFSFLQVIRVTEGLLAASLTGS